MNPEQAETNPDQGPVSRKSRELFGPEKLVVKLQSACFEKLIFFDIRKAKRIAKFDGLEPWHCEDIKAVVAPEIGPKSFGTFEKQASEVCTRGNRMRNKPPYHCTTPPPTMRHLHG